LEKVSDRPVVYVDETGIDTCLYREYGRSERGKIIVGEISGRKFKRVGIVAAKLGSSIIAPCQYDDSMESAFFEAWFEQFLLPELPEKSVIVMDNASFHRKSKLYPLAEKACHKLLFLPPYSPELNKIENFWSWLKRYLKKILPEYSSFNEALCVAFQTH
jgi:transposase